MKIMKQIVIVGGGFAGINAAKELGKNKDVSVTLIDRRNYHLFQPLLYQVAAAALSPAEIAAPIRSMLAPFSNVRVMHAEVTAVNTSDKTVTTSIGDFSYDYLIMACGAQHAYFGNDTWENYAPGLKTIEQATEIRRRILTAFEKAELAADRQDVKKHLTFIVVGGGPTGVELAGAIGEMSRYTLAKDFHTIDPKLTRIILIEAGSSILNSFDEALASRATRDLEKLGVQVWTSSHVSKIDDDGVEVDNERIQASTVLWAAGVYAAELGNTLDTEQDRRGRVIVEPDLSIKNHPNVFVAGDQANFSHQTGDPLPGVAPVALQQGRFIAQNIGRDLKNLPRKTFSYLDKGQMATIGRGRAIVETGKLKFGGFIAWLTWLVIHIYYLTGFRNRMAVMFNWAWSYLTFRRGARLIIDKSWRMYPEESQQEQNVS